MIINVLILLPLGKWVNDHFPSRAWVACQEMGANEANEAKVLCISRELKDERQPLKVTELQMNYHHPILT